MDAMIALGAIVGGFIGAAIGARMATAKIWEALLLVFIGISGAFLLGSLFPDPSLLQTLLFYYVPLIVAGVVLGLTARQIAFVSAGNFLVGFGLGFLLGLLYAV